MVTGLFLALTGCQFLEDNGKELEFHPPLFKDFRYSVAILSVQSVKELANDVLADTALHKIFDTVKLDFSIRSIYDLDSAMICKLTFINFKRKKPDISVRLKSAGLSPLMMRRNPFSVLDSIGYFLHGLSLQVVVNKKGVVKRVNGMDDLMDRLSAGSNEDEGHLRRILADYISVNAVKDLLNRLFTVVPHATVKQADKWVRNVTLVTKAPVKISNLYTLTQQDGDTARIDIQSIVSAEQSEGGTVYMKGKQNGHATVSYSTGMPSLYETSWETVTTVTSGAYEVTDKQRLLCKQVPTGWK